MKPETFTVQLNEDGIAKSCDFPKLSKYGLYCIRSGRKIIRIGESASGSERLKKGFRGPLRKVIRKRERKNYIAYSWRNKYQNRRLFIDYFSLEQESFRCALRRRVLEAEVTFQFRLANKSWPVEMSEIHFLEDLRKEVLVVEVVEKILQHYGCIYDSQT